MIKIVKWYNFFDHGVYLHSQVVLGCDVLPALVETVSADNSCKVV